MTGLDPAPVSSATMQAYDRRASPVLLEALQGPLASLLAFRAQDPSLRDLQLRREPWGTRSWATLYMGLTSVLDVVVNKHGRFKLEAHETHRQRGHFDPAWSAGWWTLDALIEVWPQVEDYLDRIQDRVDSKWLEAEGRVHAKVANSPSTGFAVINREASHAFHDTSTKLQRLAAWSQPLLSALEAAPIPRAWWSTLYEVPFGLSPDFVAVDGRGRLLVIEAKAATATAGIVRGPVQVACYAAMWRTWLEENSDARDRLHEELDQRNALGLLPAGVPAPLADPVTVVPVLLVGPGVASGEAWTRLRAVAEAVRAVHLPLAPLEVLVLGADGATSAWDWSDPDAPQPVTSPEPIEAVPYQERARAAAARWREDVLGLPSSEPFGRHLLPPGTAAKNLLPEASGAIRFFSERSLPWHQPAAGGPSRNLVSSQLQCVNALFAAVREPARLLRAFGEPLRISRIDPFDTSGAHVTFEYAAPEALLGEGKGIAQTRVDAAFRYRDNDGRTCLALVEWKYTERYFGTSGAATDLYRQLWLDPAGPLRTAEAGDGPLEYAQVLVEPFYQRVRQQLLAWRLEQETDADRVVVVHVSPPANTAYQQSLPLAAHKAAGSSVDSVWDLMLRHEGRFTRVDARVFLDPITTSRAYVDRYGHA